MVMAVARFPARRLLTLTVLAFCLAVSGGPAAAQSQEAMDQWQNTLETGRSAYASGNLVVAENFLKSAISQAMFLAPDTATNVPLAESYEAMAAVQADLGDFAEADRLMAQAIAIRRAAQPADHPDLGRAVLAFADLQRKRGNYVQADQLYRASLDTIAQALGPTHVLLVRAYYGLALNGLAQGQTAATDGLLLQAISILGVQDQTTLRDNLIDFRPIADRYLDIGRPDDAERMLRQAMSLYTQHFAADHPYFEAALMTLGTLQLDRGNPVGARQTFDDGTGRMLAQLGQGSERVASLMEEIAELFKTYAQPADAEAYFVKAFEVRQRAVGATEGDNVRGLVKLGDLYRQQGDTARAEEKYREAVALAETRLAPNSVETAYAYSSLALLLWDRGEIDTARRLWTDSLAIYEARLSPTDLNIATVAFNLAQIHHGRGEYEQALPLYDKVLNIREARLGPGHPDTLETINMYSILLDRLGRRGEAAAVRARAN